MSLHGPLLQVWPTAMLKSSPGPIHPLSKLEPLYPDNKYISNKNPGRTLSSVHISSIETPIYVPSLSDSLIDNYFPFQSSNRSSRTTARGKVPKSLMLDIVSFGMGIKTWAVTSNVLRRLNRGQSKARDTNNEQNHGFAASTSDLSGRARAAAAATRRKVEKLPLAVQILDDPSSVDQQPGCPLFAKLPAELRELIWDYALTGYEDFDALYPLDRPYARPGQAAPLRIDLELLLTCRAVYLEAFLVPFQVNPMIVFDGHPDVVPPDRPLQCTPSNLRLCRKLRPWQFANISSVDMSVQQFMLEGGMLYHHCEVIRMR